MEGLASTWRRHLNLGCVGEMVSMSVLVGRRWELKSFIPQSLISVKSGRSHSECEEGLEN